MCLQFPSASQNAELVLGTGHGKSGALTVFSRGLRTVVANRLGMEGCVAAFAVHSEAEAVDLFAVETPHTFLFLSTVRVGSGSW